MLQFLFIFSAFPQHFLDLFYNAEVSQCIAELASVALAPCKYEQPKSHAPVAAFQSNVLPVNSGSRIVAENGDCLQHFIRGAVSLPPVPGIWDREQNDLCAAVQCVASHLQFLQQNETMSCLYLQQLQAFAPQR